MKITNYARVLFFAFACFSFLLPHRALAQSFSILPSSCEYEIFPMPSSPDAKFKIRSSDASQKLVINSEKGELREQRWKLRDIGAVIFDALQQKRVPAVNIVHSNTGLSLHYDNGVLKIGARASRAEYFSIEPVTITGPYDFRGGVRLRYRSQHPNSKFRNSEYYLTYDSANQSLDLRQEFDFQQIFLITSPNCWEDEDYFSRWSSTQYPDHIKNYLNAGWPRDLASTLNDPEAVGQYKWASGFPTTLSNVCIAINKNGELEERNCDDELSFLCERRESRRSQESDWCEEAGTQCEGSWNKRSLAVSDQRARWWDVGKHCSDITSTRTVRDLSAELGRIDPFWTTAYRGPYGRYVQDVSRYIRNQNRGSCAVANLSKGFRLSELDGGKRCDLKFKVLCRNRLTGDWQTSKKLVQAYRGHLACSSIGVEYEFATPYSLEELRFPNNRLVLEQDVWINLFKTVSGNWLPSPFSAWAVGQPDRSSDHCIFAEKGFWYDSDCLDPPEQIGAACKDRRDGTWVKTAPVSAWHNGHEACVEQGEEFVFDAPQNSADNALLTDSIDGPTWINKSDDFQLALPKSKRQTGVVLAALGLYALGTLVYEEFELEHANFAIIPGAAAAPTPAGQPKKKAKTSSSSASRTSLFTQLPTRQDGELRIHYLNVGQGTCIVVERPNGQSPLIIDCGSAASDQGTRRNVGSNMGKTQVKRFINQVLERHRGLPPILFLSHPDFDHFNWLDYVLGQKNTSQTWYGGNLTAYNDSRLKPPNRVAKWVQDHSPVLNGAPNIPSQSVISLTVPPGAGHGIPVNDGTGAATGANANAFILAVNEGQTDNDHSMILQVVFGNFSVIFPGDATGISEIAALPNLQPTSFNVVTSSHHGSNTHGSNSEAFINATHPQLVIHTAGAAGHALPRGEVADRYQQAVTSNGSSALVEILPHHTAYLYGDTNLAQFWSIDDANVHGQLTTQEVGHIAITVSSPDADGHQRITVWHQRGLAAVSIDDSAAFDPLSGHPTSGGPPRTPPPGGGAGGGYAGNNICFSSCFGSSCSSVTCAN